ncbi:anhydro-N-acetylmuramic acid kinase [Phormidium sp. CLA17]|uniref:anhydro-N-acetylmuramic acid kinase n=1 Tax=Leptolyngbya sp. Cla-17 TaxID=2803751 RepID=UPI001491FA18|nr:anhydro-N-acetylmuramic acid kinase [Leptolyngbya sp. Cla-17]MBM0740650.1 anhydro-N-acetylmuramic acid kinase [Leptolyngbya sp. Cla-17]
MLVIGLISGTSVDGIDAALVEISGSTTDLRVTLIAGETIAYPTALREQILAVCAGAALSIADLAALDDAIAYHFAQAALTIQTGHPAAELIGSHGQTVFHRPAVQGQSSRYRVQTADETRSPHPLGYSLQLGRGDAIAHYTDITTISNFRAADIAVGGQGAPMVSKIDACLFGQPSQSSCVQNIGGIGNLTYLPAIDQQNDWQSEVLGWDTGPGNSLLDLAVQHLSQATKTYDHNGDWAASGQANHSLVDQWLQHPFFHQPPPKSTGRELFGVEYLNQRLVDCRTDGMVEAADILATLTELTAASIAHSYQTFLPNQPDRVLLCGGGSKNQYLKRRIQARIDPIPVLTTDDMGVDADFKEAIAFAVLAYWRLHQIPGNLPAVTGATHPVLSGEINVGR